MIIPFEHIKDWLLVVIQIKVIRPFYSLFIKDFRIIQTIHTEDRHIFMLI